MSAADIPKFFQAIRAGDPGEVGRMLAADPKLATAREESGLGPFAVAKYSRQEEIAALLLANGANWTYSRRASRVMDGVSTNC